jgi:hypothetical protein
MAAGVPAMRDALATLGATRVGYLPNHADVIDIDPANLAALASDPSVRWVGPFHPGYKAFPEDLAAIAAGTIVGVTPWNVVVTRNHDLAQKREVAQRLAALGATLKYPLAREGALITVEMPAASIPEALALDGIAWIDRWTPAEPDMDIARQFTGSNYVETVVPGGFRGQGTAGEVLDVGCLTTHVDFVGVLQHTPTMVNASHGTSTYGIVFGKGIANPAGTGMMPDGVGITGYYADATVTASRYNYTAQLLQAPYFATFQSNSWGNTQVTTYTSISQEMDNIIFGLDFPILQSQSNTGNQTSRPQAWAKNVISIGGVEAPRHALARRRRVDRGGLDRPRAGRPLKPDMAHFYDLTYCPTNTSTTAYTASFGGTSGATPITGGRDGHLDADVGRERLRNVAFRQHRLRTPPPCGHHESPAHQHGHAMVVQRRGRRPLPREARMGLGRSSARLRPRQRWQDPGRQRIRSPRSFRHLDQDRVGGAGRAGVQGDSRLRRSGRDAHDHATAHQQSRPEGHRSGRRRLLGNNGLAAGNASTPGGTSDLLNVVENVFVPKSRRGRLDDRSNGGRSQRRQPPRNVRPSTSTSRWSSRRNAAASGSARRRSGEYRRSRCST